MGHRISAVVLRGPFDCERAAGFDLRPIELSQGLTLFPLDANYCDYWADKLAVPGFVTERPMLNGRVVHHMLRAIAGEALFAVIETDYFDGQGDQCAVVYRGGDEVMASERARRGPINAALRVLGVVAERLRDEFLTVGLDRFRDWDEMFESYVDWERAEGREIL